MISISFSALQAYERCPQKFFTQYVEGVVDQGYFPSDALETGIAIHKYFEYHLTGRANELDWGTEEGVVVSEYLKRHPILRKPLHVEQTLSVPVGVGGHTILSFTPDMVSEDKNRLVVTDWKSFSKQPNLETEFDLQVIQYLAGVSRIFPRYKNFEFRHQYIRTTPPDVPKDKAGKKWAESDCYITQSTILSREMLEKAWQETVELVHEINGKLGIPHEKWRRVPLKGFDFNSCNKCPVKGICSAKWEERPYSTQPNSRGTIYAPKR